MTSLASLKASKTPVATSPNPKKGAGAGAAAKGPLAAEASGGRSAPNVAAGLSASVRASFAKLSATAPVVQPKSRPSRRPAAARTWSPWRHARRDVLVTGFPDGALGVWKTTHRDANGSAVDPSLDSDSVARWTCALVRSASRTRTPPPPLALTLPDGTQTYGGVRCLELRCDGARCSPAARTAGSTPCVDDGDVARGGRPSDAGRRAGGP